MRFCCRYEKPIVQTGTTDSDVANTLFRAIDYAGLPTTYLDKSWFKNVKERWQSNTYGLTKYREKPMIRSDQNGTSLVPFLLFPLYYQVNNQINSGSEGCGSIVSLFCVLERLVYSIYYR